jgi:hypothetical protein
MSGYIHPSEDEDDLPLVHYWRGLFYVLHTTGDGDCILGPYKTIGEAERAEKECRKI